MILVPSAIAVIVAIFVPWFTFRFALKQSRIDRLHDHRAELYVDLLTEALAEKAYFEFEIESTETQQRMRPNYHDLRLPALERARLGARGTIFGSGRVNALFNKLQGVALMTTMVGRPKNEGERAVDRLAVFDAFSALEAQVRKEMGADEIAPRA